MTILARVPAVKVRGGEEIHLHWPFSTFPARDPAGELEFVLNGFVDVE